MAKKTYLNQDFVSKRNLKSLKEMEIKVLGEFPGLPFGYKWQLEEVDFVSLLNPEGTKIAMYANPDYCSEGFIASVKEAIERNQPISDADFFSEG